MDSTELLTDRFIISGLGRAGGGSGAVGRVVGALFSASWGDSLAPLLPLSSTHGPDVGQGNVYIRAVKEAHGCFSLSLLLVR